jgi:hypothetical protein
MPKRVTRVIDVPRLFAKKAFLSPHIRQRRKIRDPIDRILPNPYTNTTAKTGHRRVETWYSRLWRRRRRRRRIIKDISSAAHATPLFLDLSLVRPLPRGVLGLDLPARLGVPVTVRVTVESRILGVLPRFWGASLRA